MTTKFTPGPWLMAAAAPAMHAALEAHAAWQWAEEKGSSLSTFNERMELCNYAQYLTTKALAEVEGKTWGEAYGGVPHMIVWPSVYISRADQDTAQTIVDRLITAWRDSIALAKADGGAR